MFLAMTISWLAGPRRAPDPPPWYAFFNGLMSASYLLAEFAFCCRTERTSFV